MSEIVALPGITISQLNKDISNPVENLLQVRDIHKHFGGVYALRGVDLEVQPGEILALIGENGAGKSTLGKIITGVLTPDRGQIFFKGSPVNINHPLEAQKLGISIIFQELDLFPDLTVGENIVIGNLEVERKQIVDFTALATYCDQVMTRVDLDCEVSTVLGDLSIGQMQKVAIARALSTNADLIVMDEPTSALPDEAVEVLFNLIRKLNQSGVSVIFVSHKMQEIFEIADRITVLRDGEKIGTRTVAETDNQELIKMMVGRDIAHISRSKSYRKDTTVLSVERLTTHKLKGISFDLHHGEVLGIAGLVGAGRSELGMALFGIDPLKAGDITLADRPFTCKNPGEAIAQKFGLLPEDRKNQGLMMDMSVKENASMSILSHLQQFGIIRESEEMSRVTEINEQISLKAESPEAEVSTLSGGNQQKVLLSRWLLVNPDVIFLDDPTRGIDIGAKEDIYQIIGELAQQGKGVLFVSSELPELLRCCDRILVLQEGHQMGILPREEATQEKILDLATQPVASS